MPQRKFANQKALIDYAQQKGLVYVGAWIERQRVISPAFTKRKRLRPAKACGVKLGGPKLSEARKAAIERNVANADQRASNVLPVIRDIQRSGASLHQVAEALNARGISTSRGGRWYAKSVSNALVRPV
jgi:hypothetical protein